MAGSLDEGCNSSGAASSAARADSIEHYAYCRSFHSLCSRFLGLTRPNTEYLLPDFVNLDGNASRSWASDALSGDECSALRAIGIYALYRTQNTVRAEALAAYSDVSELFRGFVRQAVEGHRKSRMLLSRAFKRARA